MENKKDKSKTMSKIKSSLSKFKKKYLSRIFNFSASNMENKKGKSKTKSKIKSSFYKFKKISLSRIFKSKTSSSSSKTSSAVPLPSTSSASASASSSSSTTTSSAVLPLPLSIPAPTSNVPSLEVESRIFEEVDKLRKTVLWIRKMLIDSESRDVHDKCIKLWLSELRNLAFDAEDVLSDFNYEGSEIESIFTTDTCSIEDEVTAHSRPFSTYDPSLLHGMSCEIKILMNRFDEISKHRIALHFDKEDGARRAETDFGRHTSSLIGIQEVFGRKNTQNGLINKLLSNDRTGHAFEIVPIVAMAGMGKTTLAQLVYNDKIVEEAFDLRSWIWVSEVFDVIRITRSMIESITLEACDLIELDSLQKKLKELVEGKKLLLVLDDVWNEDSRLWTLLSKPLNFAAKGSRVVITSRTEKAAFAMGRKRPFYLTGLLERHSQTLFFRHAFPGKNHDQIPKELAQLGLQIVKKCEGVPLMLKTLGGLLSSDASEEYWNEILTTDIWRLDQEGKMILQILNLSYRHLPLHLKPCFTYCALFPKGHVFETKSLVRMWMAHGLIQTKDKNNIEQTGYKYVQDLMTRSFFQNPGYVGSNYYFTMHDDLIHDLAKSIVSEESNDTVYKASQDNDRFVPTIERYNRHQLVLIKLKSWHGQLSSTLNNNHNSLRSLLIWPHNWTGCLTKRASNDIRTTLRIDASFFKHHQLIYLRSLDLSGTAIAELPSSVGDLKELRYIGLSCTNVERLPDSICRLCKLQTVDLRHCHRFVELPRGIKDLVELRHLDFQPKEGFLENGWTALKIPIGISKLTNLVTLPVFVDSPSNSFAGIVELKNLKNLRNELQIHGLQNVTIDRKGEAKEADLRSKKYLTSLTLQWNRFMPLIAEIISPSDDEEVLQNLQPCFNIQQLHIKGYAGYKFPSWMGDLLFSKLTIMRLENCNKCTQLPQLGQLPQLKHLELSNIGDIKHINGEFYGCNEAVFPSLETLRLINMQKLEDWCHEEEKYVFPCLHELKISECPNIASFSLYNMPSIKTVAIYHCYKLRRIDGLEACCSSAVIQDKNHSRSPSYDNSKELQYTKQPLIPTRLRSVTFFECELLSDIYKQYAKKLNKNLSF